MKTLKEPYVEAAVRAYLKEKGWKLQNQQKQKGEHGPDIRAFNRKLSRTIIIEAKGESKSYKPQYQATALPTLLGQILSRMDKQGNDAQKSRIYAIAAPKSWEKALKKKAKEMRYVWGLLKLKVFLVNGKNKVEDKNYRYFLKD